MQAAVSTMGDTASCLQRGKRPFFLLTKYLTNRGIRMILNYVGGNLPAQVKKLASNQKSEITSGMRGKLTLMGIKIDKSVCWGGVRC